MMFARTDSRTPSATAPVRAAVALSIPDRQRRVGALLIAAIEEAGICDRRSSVFGALNRVLSDALQQEGQSWPT